jgi:hypothetical protein
VVITGLRSRTRAPDDPWMDGLPLVARISADRPLTRRLAWPLGVVTLAGTVGIVVQRLLAPISL